MNVKAILAAKQLGGDTITIEPTANLAAAAKLLSAHRIGAVLIRRRRRASLRNFVGARHCPRTVRSRR